MNLPTNPKDLWCLNTPGSWLVLEPEANQPAPGREAFSGLLQSALKAVESSGCRALAAYAEPGDRPRAVVRIDVPDPTDAAEAARRFGWTVVQTLPLVRLALCFVDIVARPGQNNTFVSARPSLATASRRSGHGALTSS
jgi:hypothetical protein